MLHESIECWIFYWKENTKSIFISFNIDTLGEVRWKYLLMAQKKTFATFSCEQNLEVHTDINNILFINALEWKALPKILFAFAVFFV